MKVNNVNMLYLSASEAPSTFHQWSKRSSLCTHSKSQNSIKLWEPLESRSVSASACAAHCRVDFNQYVGAGAKSNIDLKPYNKHRNTHNAYRYGENERPDWPVTVERMITHTDHKHKQITTFRLVMNTHLKGKGLLNVETQHGTSEREAWSLPHISRSGVILHKVHRNGTVRVCRWRLPSLFDH